ncbi:hypothetical protein HK098_004951 [Nowakowskiella sp. JEL0407]|nr:hypothetical protein HK098_004951 [Nowakowskiella sp. JEL0407]
MFESDGKRGAELQAVILAGTGNRLSPMSNLNNMPKALLPIANTPMICYQLKWLEEAGVFDVIVMTQKGTTRTIRESLSKGYESSVKIEFVEYDADVGNLYGTADALKHIKDKIKNDFIVLGCDFVTTIPSHKILDPFRINNPSGMALFYEPEWNEALAETQKAKDDVENIFVTLDYTRTQLVDITATIDIDDSIRLRTSMINQFPRLKLHTQLRDAHVYVFKKWVIDFIASRKSPLGSLRAEFLPLLLRCQYDAKYATKEGVDKFIALSAQQDPLRDIKLGMAGLKIDSTKNKPTIKILSVIAPKEEGICVRANTKWSYAETNRQIVNDNGKVSETAEVDSSTQIKNDILVGNSTKIGQRCTIKKCIIGAHCNIGNNVKLVNCVIMDHVLVADGAKMEGCIVSNNVKVNGKVQLKDCEVAANYDFEGQPVNARNEVFGDGGW